MLRAAQFLHILAAESEHLVTVTISLPAEVKADFERRLNDAFASDSFSDTARAWNEERSRVIQETLEQHLYPVGIKWTREWIREEAEDYLARQCANILRDVSTIFLLRPLLWTDIPPAYRRCTIRWAFDAKRGHSIRHGCVVG